MAKLVLHIGTEKTGTTTIQAFLAENRLLLKKQGIVVPDFLGGNNHWKFPCMAYSDKRNDDLTNQASMASLAQRKSTILLWEEQLRHAIEKHSMDKWIISSEHLSSRLASQEEVRNLKNIIDRYYSEVMILVYIRKPIDTAVSLWSTCVRGGQYIPRLPHPSETYWKAVCNHKALILRWREFFNDKIEIRIFDKNEFIGKDLLVDFAASSGINILQEFTIPQRENETLSAAGLSVMNAVNKNRAERIDRESQLRRAIDIQGYVAKWFSQFPKYVPTLDETREYDDYYKESLEWIRQSYFPDKEALFQDRDRGNTRSLQGYRGGYHLSQQEESLVNCIVDIADI